MTEKTKGPVVQLMATWVKAHPSFLVHEEMLRDLLEELIVALDMTVLVPTLSVKVPALRYVDPVTGRAPNNKDFGLTLFTVISESHLAIHTWPDHQKAWVEVASCKLFEESIVEEILRKFFPGCELESWKPEEVVKNESSDIVSLRHSV
jgi:S-adenosylmethionine/arginine decarboxylase-like enzyme